MRVATPYSVEKYQARAYIKREQAKITGSIFGAVTAALVVISFFRPMWVFVFVFATVGSSLVILLMIIGVINELIFRFLRRIK